VEVLYLVCLAELALQVFFSSSIFAKENNMDLRQESQHHVMKRKSTCRTPFTCHHWSLEEVIQTNENRLGSNFIGGIHNVTQHNNNAT
jgi:hypothetical protein